MVSGVPAAIARIAAAVGVVAAFGCHHTVVALRPEAAMVQILSGEPAGCIYVGDVTGQSDSNRVAEAMIGARNDLRNQTAQLGGNVAVVSLMHQDMTAGLTRESEVLFVGRALRCPVVLVPPGGPAFGPAVAPPVPPAPTAPSSPVPSGAPPQAPRTNNRLRSL